LIVPCILAGCPENGVVLDPFGGAGTTAVVAKQHNRKSVLVELNPEYVELQKERLQQQMFNFDEATTEERQPPLLFGEEVPEESEKAQA
jgi:DNA modification methylase